MGDHVGIKRNGKKLRKKKKREMGKSGSGSYGTRFAKLLVLHMKKYSFGLDHMGWEKRVAARGLEHMRWERIATAWSHAAWSIWVMGWESSWVPQLCFFPSWIVCVLHTRIWVIRLSSFPNPTDMLNPNFLHFKTEY